MMNKKGQFGFALLILFFFFLIGALATIEPLKEVLDDVRGNSALNCKGTPDFNQTAFDLDEGNRFEKLNKRATCFVTGLAMIYFVMSFILAAVVWLVKNWLAIPKKI